MQVLRCRSKTQTPPAWALYEALQDPIADQERREWLNLRDGELPPRVLQAVLPSRVIWTSLWPDRPDDQIRFDIEDQRLTWTLLGEASDEDEERLDQLRHRLNVLINADLRSSFGQ
ncbi:MAG: hypothetical protein ACYCO9_21355 [Streptosporangiaceae bacterium]